MTTHYITPEMGEVTLELADLSLANASWSNTSGGGSYGNSEIEDNGSYDGFNY